MPTYEYLCKQCGENFDIYQSFSDKPLKEHDACGGELQKVFHARGIVFRGSGFYATDNKAKSSTETKSEKKKKSKTDSSSSAKLSDTTSSPKSKTASRSS